MVWARKRVTRTQEVGDTVNNVEAVAAGAKQVAPIATPPSHCLSGLLPQREVTNSNMLFIEILCTISTNCLILLDVGLSLSFNGKNISEE